MSTLFSGFGRLVALLLGLMLPLSAHAQTPPLPRIKVGNVGEVVTKVLCPIADAMFALLIGIAIIMVMVAAYFYLTSSGNPEKVGTATKMITYSVVAVVIALVAKGAPLVIASVFTRASFADFVCPI